MFALIWTGGETNFTSSTPSSQRSLAEPAALLAMTYAEHTSQESEIQPASRPAGRVRVATWNVERPKPRGWRIPQAQRTRMADVDADIWVLTETHVEHAPTPRHVHRVFSPPHQERRPEHERWAAIWSLWPLTPVENPAPHRRGTIAALAHTPHGQLLIYATVIAWANEKTHDDGKPARMWQVHHREAERQAKEWTALRRRYPDVPMLVAGDFNQDRDGSGYYGTARGRNLVTEGLEQADLVCIRAFDAVARGDLSSQHLVDHICVSRDLAASPVGVLERVDNDGVRLSDHPTLFVDLDLDRAASAPRV